MSRFAIGYSVCFPR